MIESYTHTLPNGLRVVCCEMPHLHAAELAIYLKAGGRNDPAGKEGVSHFLEHILFRGTKDFPSSLDIETEFESIGGAPNAATDAESTCYYSRIHPDHFRRGMEIFASMLMRPLLDGIEIEKKIITEEAREDLNEDGEEINPDNIASRLLWPRHPLGLPTIGTLESIASMNRADLESHLNQFYVPNNAVVVIAGPVSNQQIFASAEEIFGAWQPGALPLSKLVSRRENKPLVRFVHDSDSQINLQISFLGISRPDPRFIALRLLRRLLAGGGSSRLHLRLREELGIVYSVEASLAAYDETGCLAIDLSTAPYTLNLAVESTLAELGLIAAGGAISEAELNRVRQAYIYDLDYSRDSAYEMGVRYGWGELMGIVKSIEQDQQEAEGITVAGLQETVRFILAPENLRLVAVGPWKRSMKKQVKELVAQYADKF